MRRLVFLGYVIDENGIQADPERIRPIVEFPQPKTVKDVRRLIGMASWYRRFINNFSTITAPISELIRKSKEKFVWSDEADEAFERLKIELVSAPILATPDFDQPFQIECDASDLGIGGVLTQSQNGERRVIAYMSSKLTATQRKYQVTERECLAVISAMEKFRPYIEGVHFTVLTDHASLQWLRNLKDPAGRLARWALRMQAYDYTIEHRKGTQMVVPDALSRAMEALTFNDMSKTVDADYIALRGAIARSPAQYIDLRIDGQLILKHVNTYADAIDDAWRIYVPADYRTAVIQQFHDDRLAAHGGIFKTLIRMRRHYYWPSARRDITEYVKNCSVCNATKPTTKSQAAPMGRYRDPERPFKMVCIDFIGPVTRSSCGHRHIVVAIDNFSKFVVMRPLRLASAEATVKFLENEVFYQYGVPAIVVSDNGPQLRSAKFAKCLREHNIEHWKTPAYHPQANATEAVNKTIMNAVRAYVRDDRSQRNWDTHLPAVACAINSAIHTTTKYAPYKVLFGYDMITDGQLHLPCDQQSSIRQPTDVLATIRKRVSAPHTIK